MDLSPARDSAGQVDDLIRIEGVGPKIAGLLKANGTGIFQQLAALRRWEEL